MEKTIKYLENGEYHYATVKDVGDLAKLKTDSKDDLVTALNELYLTGGEAPKKPDGYDELVDNVADAIQKQQQMTDTITNMQQSAQLSDAEMEHMKQVQEELHQEYLKAVEGLNKAVEKAKADAAALDKKTNDMQGKIDETFADVNKEVSDVHKQLDAEAKGLHKDLDETKTNLEATRKDLLNSTQEYGQVHSEVKELQDKFNRRVWSTDLDPIREQVSKNSTEVQQTKDELKRKADQSNLDLVTNSVEDLSAQVKQNASGLEVAVKRDELGGDVSRLLNDKTNLLLGTRNFSGSNWLNKEYWHEEPGYWNGLKVYSSEQQYYGIQYQYYVKAGNTYTFSLWAKQDVENLQAAFYLLAENKEGIVDPLKQENVIVKTEWTRVHITFDALQDAFIYPRLEQTVVKNKLYVAGYKLELGKNATPWEPNEADIAENIEHTESQFNVYSDQIAGIVKKQEKMGDTERQLDTRITETAEGLKQTSKDLQDANGKITEFKGQLESTAHGLKTEYEKYTNDAIGQISDSSLNLIHNSAFSSQDNQFESWQNISAKATVREDSNNLHWVELTQSGQGTDNPIGVTSNYFIIKQGKVTVAVDVKLGDKTNLDNQNILLLELYDESKKRVDFTDVSVSQLGLSMSVLNDHNVHRGLYRLGIDRKDVKYMTVKAILHRNGDLYFTNFSARLSSIDDGAYEPNPDDLNQQILKQNTKIEQNSKEVAIKANSVDVTRDIKSAVDGIKVGGTNLAAGTNQEYTMGYGIPNTIWKDGNAYATLPTTGSGNEILPQDPHMFWYTLTAGQEYTQTIWFRTDAMAKDLKASGITWFTSDGHDYQPATIQKIGPNSYKLFCSYKWPGKNNNDVRLFDISELRQAFDLNTGTYLKFGKLKLEEGNKSTSWAPAPEDISTEIKSAKDAAIQVASDQINIHVNELSTSFDDKLNRRVNEVKTASEKFTSDGIEQVVTKVTNVKNDVDRLGDTVGNLEVGGRNLLIGTSEDELSGKSYNFADYQISGGLQPNKTYTLSGWARVDQDSLNHHQNVFVDAYSEDWSWSVTLNINSALTSQYNKITFTTPNGKQLHPYVTVYLSHPDGGTNGNNNDAISGKAYIKKLKLEEGNFATDYTHAPEDINQSIKDATEYKTVTGTIDFNDLKTQQKIFYKDTQATNTPVGGSYWYYLNVEPGTDGRIFQTAISDRDNITWVRTFADSWSPWIRQADQRNVDDLNNQISSFKTETTASVKNLGDRVTTEVNSITKKVDTNNGGGVNLLKATDFSSTDLTKLKDVWGSHFTLRDGKAMQLDQLKGNGDLDATQFLPVEPDTDYTLSFEAYYNTVASGGSYNNIYTFIVEYKDQNNTTPHYLDHMRVVANTADRSKNIQTIHTQKDCHYVQVFFRASAKTLFSFWRPKLERGSVATPWSPAPEDTSDAIKKLSTKWDVANGQIQGKVTATDVNNILNGKGYATQSWAQSNFRMKSDSIELEVRKITDPISNKINNLQVGGRNLLANSSNDISVTSHTTDGYPAWANIDTGFSFEHGKMYTFSAEAKNSTDKIAEASIRVFEYSTNTQVGIYAFPADGERHSVTFTIPNDSHDYHLLLYAGHAGIVPGVNVTTTFHHPKLELGNVATDWTPAPEDTSAEIKSAKDAAIQVASDQINIHVNEITSSFDDKLNKRVNEVKTASEKFTSDGIEQTVKKITDVKGQVDGVNDKVNNLKVGGRNLVRNTDTDIVIDDTGNTGTQGWRFATIPLTQQTKIGDQVTVSAEGTLTGKGNLGTYDVILYNSTVSNARSNSKRLSSGKRASATLQVNNLDGNGDTVLLIYAGNISDTEGKKNTVHHLKVEFGNLATDWTPAPEDINQKIDTQTLDSANIDEMKTQGHYFVHNLTGNPIGGWVYVDVTGNNNDRIRQDVYQDNGSKHMYRRGLNGTWSGWEQGAYLSDVNSLKTEVTASVKNLGDRVTTEVNSITSKVNEGHSNDVELIRNSNFPDGNKGSWNGNLTTVIDGNSIPAELGQNGMKVLRVAERDTYEDDIWYSVKPGEIFDVDYWIWPTGLYDSQLGLYFVDKDKGGSTWRGVVAKKGTGWTHYTGTIEAPSNAAFAKPWIQINKDASETGSAAWIGKPSIRRHDTFAEKKISEINTKLDVANGKIEGKVTETDVNNILNGKGYATQSWAETMFTMKSDSITLQAVRDNITNGIQNQVNGINNKIDTQTLDSADVDNMRTQGHYFVKNLTGNPIGGWVYVDVTGNNNDRLKQEVYQDNGYEHRSRRWYGSYWTEWTTDVNNKNIVSQINITPDQIKIASNKIVIDGNTDIHGVLDVEQVTLQGKNGNIDLSGDSGIKIGNNVGATLDLNSNGVDIAYKNEFKMDINSSHLALMQRNADTDQKEPVTIGIFKGGYTKGDNARAFLINYNPGSATDAQLHGADFMALGYTDPNNIGSSQSQIQLISRNFTSKKGVSYRKGVKFYDDITLQPYQKINIGDNDKEPDGKWTNDQLMIHRVNWKTSSQTDRYQPTIRLGWDSKTLGTAGVTFLWDQLKPFGNRDISDLGDIWFNGMKFAFGYVHNNRMFGGADQPAFMRIDPSNGSIMSGIAFAPGSTWDLGSGAWNITASVMNHGG